MRPGTTPLCGPRAPQNRSSTPASPAAQNLGTSSSGGTFELQYGKDWSVSDGSDAAYVLRAAVVETGISGLNKAHITVTAAGKGDVIFEIDIAWQGGRSV